MENTRLITTLRLLDRRERRRLREFLASPFFNKRTMLLDFYVAIEESILKKPPPTKVKSEALHKRLRTGKPYSKKEFEKRSGELLQLVYQFLSQLELEFSEGDTLLRLLSNLERRQADGLLGSQIRRAAKYFQNNAPRNPDYHFRLFDLEGIRQGHFRRSQARHSLGNHSKGLDHLDTGYFAHLFKLLYIEHNEQKIVGKTVEVDRYAAVVARIQENPAQLQGLPALWFRLFMSEVGEDKYAHFAELRRILKASGSAASPSEYLQIYT
ncbi:MAG: hypothetical protein AAF570_16395, partial [Bacteroidota bacterium]